MEQVIKRISNLVVMGGAGWVDAEGNPLQAIVIQYSRLTAEVNPGNLIFHFESSTLTVTFLDVPAADFSNVADLIDGAWVGNKDKVTALLSDNYSEQTPQANHLVIMRKFLTNGKTQTLFETVNSQTTVNSDCYAIRFVNCGKNTVMVDQMPLDNNETLDIPGETNFTLETKFQIIFDDGTTGRPIVKK